MRLHAYVAGRVQGVFFRQNVHEFCVNQGLNGWVKNLADGRVELVAEGSRVKLDELLTFIKNHPGNSHVESIDYVFSEERVFDCFRIIR